MKIFNLLLLFLLLSCNRTDLKKQVYSQPEWKEPAQALTYHLAFTSQFQGEIYGETKRYKEAEIIDERLVHHNLQIGGGDTLKSYINIYKKRYGDRFILIDTGEIFQSPTSFDENEKTLMHYEELGYDAIGFTKKDFLALNYLTSSATKRPEFNLNFSNENIIDLQLGTRIKRTYLSPYKIIKKDGIKFGLIFLETIKGPDSTINGIYVQDPIISLLHLKKEFRREKVDFSIIVINTPTLCQADYGRKPKALAETGTDISCPAKDPLKDFISRMPPFFGDIVVSPSSIPSSGHINSKPVLLVPGKGQFIGRAQIVYDSINKKFDLKQSALLSPLKLCQHFFAATEDCFIPPRDSKEFQKRIDGLAKNKFKKIKAKFLGEEIQINNK
ncbi:MAG: hypothetical protein ACO2ZP_07020 [Bacteriovoracaceae bacterium]